MIITLKTLLIFLFVFFLIFQFNCDLISKKEINLIKPYPLQSRRIIENIPVDSNGVAVVNYGGNLGKRYNPVSICKYAHSLYVNYYHTKDKKYKKSFMIQVKWLVENQKIKNGIGVWEYNFENKSFKATPPWISAMAQGLAISVFSEAYSLTKKDEYIKKAYLALKSFQKSIDQGGVVSYWPNGDIWYEEVATEGGNKILNGFIYSLAGIYDFYKLTDFEEAKRILDKGFKSLNNHIHQYDIGYISRYSLLPYNVHWRYNKIHVLQLIWAYSITENKKFLEYAKIFSSYDPISFNINVSCVVNIKHGPERLNDNYMFNNYWSCKKFPVDIKIKLDEEQDIKGFVFYCFSEEACPKDYTIIFKDGKGIILDEFKILDNKHESIEIKNSKFVRTKDSTYVRVHNFCDKLITSRNIVISIKTDNGNNNVALREIAFIANKDKEIKEMVNRFLILAENKK